MVSPSERMVGRETVEDFDVVCLAHILAFQKERVEVELDDETDRCANEPSAVDAVWVNARMARRPEVARRVRQNAAAFCITR